MTNQQKKWEALRPEIDNAIREGLSAEDFMALKNIKRSQWYLMKPKKFHWSSIQRKLGVKVSKTKILKTTETPQEELKKPIVKDAEYYRQYRATKKEEKVVTCSNSFCQKKTGNEFCLECDNKILKSILMIYKDGFKPEHILKYI